LNIFNGKKMALATGGDSDTSARYRNFTLLTNVPDRWKLFFNITLDMPYTNELEKVADKRSNKIVKPAKEESSILGWAKRLIKLYYGDYGIVKISETVKDSFNNDLLGMYDPIENIIWLKRSILTSRELTFKTLLHEVIHRNTGATDNTARFTNEWEEACWRILNRGKVG